VSEDEVHETARQIIKDKLRSYNVRSLMDRRHRRERVAFLTVGGRVVEIQNLAKLRGLDDREHFVIRNQQLGEIPTGDSLWAILHTHPMRSKPEPSEHDLKSTGGRLSVVLHVASGRLTAYTRYGELVHTYAKRYGS
jgi:proteasome lid subunit RPN8/RPN11